MLYSDKIKYIHQYLSGELTPEEMRSFIAWKDGDIQHTLLFNQIRDIWSVEVTTPQFHFDANKAFLKHKALIDNEKSIPEVKEAIIKKLPLHTTKVNWFLRIKYIAAILVLVIGALFIFENRNTAISSEEPMMMVLSDGSKVWLEKNASLDMTDFGKGSRKLSLQGKGYFEVTPDKNAPFTVSTDGFEIKVLGTKFIVSSDDKKVNVKEGKVEVSNATKKVFVTADQQASVSQNEINVAQADFDGLTLWFNENLEFNNTPFDVVIHDLEVFYNTKFILPSRKDWTACTFTSGPLKTNSIDQVLTMLKLTYDLEYTRQNDNNIKISKVKCK